MKYRHKDQTLTIYFPNPRAQLPVRLRDGGAALLPWGRRSEQAGQLPAGGWARLDSIQTGKWERYAARPVRIEVDAFMEKDSQGKSHWYALEPGQCLQGLVAQSGDEQRVYVVTLTPEDPALRTVHDRFPRVLTPGAR